MAYAITFPGQGSQSIGMLDALLDSHPHIVADTFAEGSDAIDIDLMSLCQRGPVESINQTAITQPLMLCADIALWRVVESECHYPPTILAGHSLGEYAALVVAKSLSLSDATKLVHRRGQLMQQAVSRDMVGVAAIIGLEDAIVIEICEQLSDQQIVSAVNFNAPGQVVIAGHRNKVLLAIDALKKANAKRTVMLPLSVPVHCQLLEPIAIKFMEALSQYTFSSPEIPIIHNSDNSRKNSPKAIRESLGQQIHSPVDWVGCIQAIANHSSYNHIIVECGPGKVLFGLNKRIQKGAQHFSLYDHATIQQFMTYLQAHL